MKSKSGKNITKYDAIHVYCRQAIYFKTGMIPISVLDKMTVAKIYHLCSVMFSQQTPRKKNAFERAMKKNLKRKKFTKMKAFRYGLLGKFLAVKNWFTLKRMKTVA